MNQLKLNENSCHKIITFNNFMDLAELTLNYIKSGSVAISGGSTYAALFDKWQNLNPNCKHSCFFPVDERIVPINDVDSNWGVAYNSFLKPIDREIDKENFADTLDHYQQILDKKFNNQLPIFDVIFLGVGDDGHTASLFPGLQCLDDRISTLLQTISPKPPYNRITLAPKVLLSAKNLITIVAGKSKTEIAKKIFIDKDHNLPIVRLLSERTESTIYLEKELADSL